MIHTYGLHFVLLVIAFIFAVLAAVPPRFVPGYGWFSLSWCFFLASFLFG